MADENTQKPEEDKGGLSWGDIALVGVSLAAIPFTGGLSGAGLAVIGARFAGVGLVRGLMARAGTSFVGRSLGAGAAANVSAGATGAATRAAATEAFKDGASAATSTAGNTLRSLFMAPVKGPTSAGTYGNLVHKSDGLFHKAGDTVYQFSKGRAIATGVGALALDGTVTDGLIGRGLITVGQGGANVATGVGGAALDGAGKLGTEADNRLTGGQGQALVKDATRAITGAVGGSGTAADDTVIETDENGQQRRVPRDQAQGINLQRMLSGMMEKAKNDPAMALGIAIGAAVGLNKSNNLMEAAIKAPLYATMFGFIFKMMGPIVAPLLGAAGNMIQQSSLQTSFHTAQVTPSAAVPTTSAPAPATAPTADSPAAAANASRFHENAASMTLPHGTTDNVGRPVPAANRDLFLQPAYA